MARIASQIKITFGHILRKETLSWIMTNCEVCLQIHGEGCAASYRDSQGRAVCVFCADSLLCPKMMQILKRKIKEDQMNGTDKPPSLAAETLPALARTCKAPGCNRKLVFNNKSGFCQKHTPARAHSKANGHCGSSAALSKANGNGTSPQQQSAVEERVNLVLSGIPLEEKMRMLTGWLAGKS
jgi:hypothetical protein